MLVAVLAWLLAVQPPATIAATLLDERVDRATRDAMARDAAPRAREVVLALVDGLPADDTEEYRRIPWIWRVAVATGRSGDDAALMYLLDASMPAEDEPLRDWQAVVIGGGIVMGLSQAGEWPRDVITPWLGVNQKRAARWARVLDLSSRMADDARVRSGTRFDALRVLGASTWDAVGEQLLRYLGPEVDAELQWGAIGAISDIEDPRADQALVGHLAQFAAKNRPHAVAALMRTDARRQLLRDGLRHGLVPRSWLTPAQRAELN